MKPKDDTCLRIQITIYRDDGPKFYDSLIGLSPGGRRRRILRCMWRGADAEEGLLQQPREQLQAGEAPTPQISPDESADSNAHDQSSFGQPIASTGLFIVPTAMRSKNDR